MTKITISLVILILGITVILLSRAVTTRKDTPLPDTLKTTYTPTATLSSYEPAYFMNMVDAANRLAEFHPVQYKQCEKAAAAIKGSDAVKWESLYQCSLKHLSKEELERGREQPPQ